MSCGYFQNVTIGKNTKYGGVAGFLLATSGRAHMSEYWIMVVEKPQHEVRHDGWLLTVVKQFYKLSPEKSASAQMKMQLVSVANISEKVKNHYGSSDAGCIGDDLEGSCICWL
jgi:hypothetical protein